MFAPFYSIFLALAMVGSTFLPAAETDSVELASYTDTSSMISQDSDLAGCPYHTDCPNYPDCTPALDGSGNPWSQDDTSSDTTANQGYRHGQANGNGVCAQDGSCQSTCPNYPDCTPALDGSSNPWSQDDTSSDTTANQGYRHGQANGNGVCAQDGSCQSTCPNYPDCTPALDGSGNPWNQDDTSSDTTTNQGYRHGQANGNGHHRNR